VTSLGSSFVSGRLRAVVPHDYLVELAAPDGEKMDDRGKIGDQAVGCPNGQSLAVVWTLRRDS